MTKVEPVFRYRRTPRRHRRGYEIVFLFSVAASVKAWILQAATGFVYRAHFQTMS